ncbi:hypothetical protein BH11VER1_BH11VER1_11920 [soil metagenome]
MNRPKPYQGRIASLATKHGKDKAIARPLRHALGLQVLVPQDCDTDLLGTFSGEVARLGSALEVCERKARMGMALTGLSVGIANEGSFGPHPYFLIIPVGLEVMTFVDDELGLVITESLFSKRTNYNHREASDIDEIEQWLSIVRFPSHALVVRPKSAPIDRALTKGVVTKDELAKAIKWASVNSTDGTAWIETDMRAHFNPTRMTSIRQLAFRLARRLATQCPTCNAPGWGQTDVVKGLPCEECDAPTTLTLFRVFSCSKCIHREEKRSLEVYADPQFCPYCNP